MTIKIATHVQLNRAYVQSKVIEANLRHLGAAMSLAEGNLRRDVQSFTDRFEDFVLRLSEASDVAAANEAAACDDPGRPAIQTVGA